MKKYFLFDLDGTITDTGEGIMKSAQYALDAFGIPQQAEAQLRRFVGPPLYLSFERFYGLSPQQALEAVEKYRERYRVKGVFESPLYEGMDEVLAQLSQVGTLCLATSKPLVYAKQILELRGVDCAVVRQDLGKWRKKQKKLPAIDLPGVKRALEGSFQNGPGKG